MFAKILLNIDANLATADILVILTIMIAISAYTSVVRQRLFDKKRYEKNESCRNYYLTYIRAIVVGDLLFLQSIMGFGIALFIRIEIFKLEQIYIEQLLNLSLFLFFFGIIWLLSLHVSEWIRSFNIFSSPADSQGAGRFLFLFLQLVSFVCLMLIGAFMAFAIHLNSLPAMAIYFITTIIFSLILYAQKLD